MEIILDLRSQFGPESYNLVKKNCNSFANALVWALLRKTIPSHINRLADIGSFCSCLLPQKMLEAAPVGDDNTSSSGFQVSGGRGRYSSMTPGKTQMSRPAFSGAGNTLGSSSSVSTNSNVRRSNSDDLTDRREKARMAALARLQQKENAM